MFLSDCLCICCLLGYTIYEMFHSRYSLFKQVYSHRVAKSVEYMVTDVLLLGTHIISHTAQQIHLRPFCVPSMSYCGAVVMYMHACML